MPDKFLIFDSSSIISLALNNLLSLLPALKKNFNGKFIITQQVKSESIDKPLNIKKYELEALMINQLLNDKILELPSDDLRKELSAELTNILEKANHTYKSDSEWIKIIGLGEASCIALSNILDRKKISNALAIDERTARMLCEKPENLRKLFESKLHRKIEMQTQNLPFFKNKRIIRSSELAYIAYKKNLLDIKDGLRLIDALLYGVKYKGCAISKKEIEEVKRRI